MNLPFVTPGTDIRDSRNPSLVTPGTDIRDFRNQCSITILFPFLISMPSLTEPTA